MSEGGLVGMAGSSTHQNRPAANLECPDAQVPGAALTMSLHWGDDDSTPAGRVPYSSEKMEEKSEEKFVSPLLPNVTAQRTDVSSPLVVLRRLNILHLIYANIFRNIFFFLP